jgi:hypothetical protein
LESPPITLREDLPPVIEGNVSFPLNAKQPIVIDISKQRVSVMEALPIKENVKNTVNYKVPEECFMSQDALFAEYQLLNPINQEKFIVRLKAKYVSVQTPLLQALTIMNFCIERKHIIPEYAVVDLLMQRIQITRKEPLPDVDAYTTLLFKLFPRASDMQQEKILCFVKEIWNKHMEYKIITANYIGNIHDKEMSRRSIKTYTPFIQSELRSLQQIITKQAEPEVVACLERNGHALVNAVGSGD